MPDGGVAAATWGAAGAARTERLSRAESMRAGRLTPSLDRRFVQCSEPADSRRSAPNFRGAGRDTAAEGGAVVPMRKRHGQLSDASSSDLSGAARNLPSDSEGMA